jgi:hypothetical protein
VNILSPNLDVSGNTGPVLFIRYVTTWYAGNRTVCGHTGN